MNSHPINRHERRRLDKLVDEEFKKQKKAASIEWHRKRELLKEQEADHELHRYAADLADPPNSN